MSCADNKKMTSGSRGAMAAGVTAHKTERDPLARVMMALQHRAGSQACQPIAAQAALGTTLLTHTPTTTIKPNATITPTPPTNDANQTAQQAAARQTKPTPMPCGREIRRLHGTGVCTLFIKNAILGSVSTLQVLIIHRVRVCVRVCVAGHHHATLCRVDLHGVITLCVLRGQRKGPLHLSIGPAMVVRKDLQRRCGNMM